MYDYLYYGSSSMKSAIENARQGCSSFLQRRVLVSVGQVHTGCSAHESDRSNKFLSPIFTNKRVTLSLSVACMCLYEIHVSIFGWPHAGRIE